MKKTWLILFVCFVLMLSGCMVQKPQDDEVASVITEEQPPAEDEKQNDVGQPPAEELNEDNADVDTVTDEEHSESDDGAILFEKERTSVTYVGDGFVILSYYRFDQELLTSESGLFKLYTDNEYISEIDDAVFSGKIIPLDAPEQHGTRTVSYVAESDCEVTFSFDPSDLNVEGYVRHLTDDSFILLYSANRGMKVYVENSSEYCEGDYVNIQGVATEIESFTVTNVGGGQGVVRFEVRDAQISIANEPVAEAKPVIYLYPEEETEVSVGLTYDGKLTCTYPEYNGGWQVTARPDGTLFDKNGREYYCLYWEGEPSRPRVYDKNVGFVVKGADTAEFLREKLLYLGLTEREANEFIIYWLPQMEDNNYNYIYFSGEEYTESAKLDIAPKPDTLIRIMMAWEPLESPRAVTEQKLTKAPERKGFTAVEWGGARIG